MFPVLADVRPYGDVKCVRSDGGGEFTSEVFNSLLTKNRIKQIGYDKQSPAYLVYFPHRQQDKTSTDLTLMLL